MVEAAPTPPSSRPYLAMGLTFLLLGIGFANPVPLVHAFPHGMWQGQISLQALNLYALTVFLGWGHFFYAWQGQWRGSARLAQKSRASYWLTVALVLVILVALRGVAGVGTFSLVTWVYNIAHFIKAERHFSGGDRAHAGGAQTNFYMPAIAFAWFTLVLFRVGGIADTRLVFAGSIAIAALALIAGDWRALSSGDVKLPLLTLFLLGETMVWNAYAPLPTFAVGVYVMHVAAASFFHYLGGYFYAQRGKKTPILLRPPMILLVNLLLLWIGYWAARLTNVWPLQFLFAPEWFTLWVALHLVASDLLPVWKRRRIHAPSPATTAETPPLGRLEPVRPT